MENRRQFTRILYSINATLEVEGQIYPVSLHDISLNGALITTPATDTSLIGKSGNFLFSLTDTDLVVEMNITVVHETSKETGLRCNAIDIDSISHLRRLIELNLDDEAQVNKELSQLTSVT